MCRKHGYSHINCRDRRPRRSLKMATHKPMFKVFARLFQKAVQSRAQSPCRRPQTAKLPCRQRSAGEVNSFAKGKRRGEPTRQRGSPFLCVMIIFVLNQIKRLCTNNTTILYQTVGAFFERPFLTECNLS